MWPARGSRKTNSSVEKGWIHFVGNFAIGLDDRFHVTGENRDHVDVGWIDHWGFCTSDPSDAGPRRTGLPDPGDNTRNRSTQIHAEEGDGVLDRVAIKQIHGKPADENVGKLANRWRIQEVRILSD